jgi:hypothetical protein
VEDAPALYDSCSKATIKKRIVVDEYVSSVTGVYILKQMIMTIIMIIMMIMMMIITNFMEQSPS